ncbi:hypothetical protein LCGC14_1099090 [marine sediment metagenome]|uniref:Uncharacterized protein n=1 Tax=marine sediment metagenome TaxID=412755 RepID=A0A0F9MA61_9ZZZZ
MTKKTWVFGLTVLEVLLGVMLTANVAALAWGASQIVSVGERVVVLETGGDMFQTKELSASEHLEIWREIESAVLGARESPPKWFVDRVDRLERKIEGLAGRRVAPPVHP